MSEKNELEVKDGIAEMSMSCVSSEEFNHDTNIRVLRPLYNTMKRCYGPYGASTFITSNGEAIFTKDGISILGSLVPTNDIVRPFLSVLKETAARSDLKAGDGTTTVTLGIIDAYEAAAENNVTISNEFVNKVVGYINEHKKVAVTYEDMFNVVKVAVNHNPEFYKIFNDIFRSQEDDGVPLDSFDITTRTIDDASSKEDFKLTFEKTVGVKTMAYPALTKGVEPLDGCKVVVIQHAIETIEHIAKLTSLLISWVDTFGPTSNERLVMLTPSLNEVMKKKMGDIVTAVENMISMQTKTKCKLNIEIIPMVSPVADGFDAASEIGKAICAPIISLVVQSRYEIDENGTGGTSVELTNNELLALYKDAIKIAPRANFLFNEFDNSTRIIPIAETINSNLYNEKMKTIKELEFEVKNATVSANRKEEMNQRLNMLNGGSIVIIIRAHSGKKIRFLEDTFKDACLHLRRAKSGVIAGMNIAMLKAIRNTEASNRHEQLTKDILTRTYYKMCETLVDLKANYCAKRMIKFDVDAVLNTISDIVSKQDSTLDEGYDLKADRISNEVLSAADNEITLFKTIVEVANLFMETNQITFDDSIVGNWYANNSINYY